MTKVIGFYTKLEVEKAGAGDVFVLLQNGDTTPFKHLPDGKLESLTEQEVQYYKDGTYIPMLNEMNMGQYLEKTKENLPEHILGDSKSIYKYLKDEGVVDCDYEEFNDGVIIFTSVHLLFDYIYDDLEYYEAVDLVFELSRVKKEDLEEYDSVAEYYCSGHEMVYYIESLDVYLFVNPDYVVISEVA